MIYVVRAGDTLSGVAGSLGLSPELLALQNGLEHPERLVVGQALTALTPDVVHTVAAGDSLNAVALAYGTTLGQLYRNNPWLAGLSNISPGEKVIISYTETPRQELVINGYAYPFAEISLLRQELPYLSAVLPFTYGFTVTGELVPIDEDEILRAAEIIGTQTIMVVSPMNTAGQFSSELIGRLVNDPRLRRRLIEEIRLTVLDKGYAGADLDFEYVRREDADAYVDFVGELAARLHEFGRILSLDLALKYSAEQRGLLYEGHDYQALGAAADLATLMTYEWGYTYGPPLAVAPIYEVQRVIAYGLSEIPGDKLLLGIANYGYDWSLPYEEGSAARSLSNPQAYELAWRYGAEIVYDETAQAPTFYYRTEEGTVHQVWFEDARSLQAKLELAAASGLMGVNFWTVNRPFPSGFMLMGSQFRPAPLPAAP
ncbi:MAG: LysM peptidoglycan-binding domain-containing protein [Firmicutes bacterium]|nr:LysM peptidoglycan-binding domain-containing protein [Bacillota bacterium]